MNCRRAVLSPCVLAAWLGLTVSVVAQQVTATWYFADLVANSNNVKRVTLTPMPDAATPNNIYLLARPITVTVANTPTLTNGNFTTNVYVNIPIRVDVSDNYTTITRTNLFPTNTVNTAVNAKNYDGVSLGGRVFCYFSPVVTNVTTGGSANAITNTQTGVTLTGSFTATGGNVVTNNSSVPIVVTDGAGTTSTVDIGSITAKTITGSIRVNGGELVGTHIGDGSGLTNLPVSTTTNASLLTTGTLPDARLSGNVSQTTKIGFVTRNSGRAPTHKSSPAGGTAFGSRFPYIASTDITNIALVYANWYGISEASVTNAAGITASIEWPSNTINRIYFSGQVQGTIPDRTNLVSDFLPMVTNFIPKGAIFWVRTFYTNSAGIVSSTFQTKSPSTLYGVTAEVGTSLTDKTGTTGPIGSQPSNYNCYQPIAVLGTVPANEESILILGDSRDQGDLSDTSSGLMWAADKYYENYGKANVAIGGGGTFDVMNNRLALLQYATVLHTDYGYNGGPEMSAWATNIIGVKVVAETLSPGNTSSDGWRTLSGQALGNRFPTYNTQLRNGQVAGVNICYDVAAVTESSLNSGLWAVNGTSNWLTGDGIHGDYYDQVRASLGDPLTSKPMLSKFGGVVNGAIAPQGVVFNKLTTIPTNQIPTYYGTDTNWWVGFYNGSLVQICTNLSGGFVVVPIIGTATNVAAAQTNIYVYQPTNVFGSTIFTNSTHATMQPAGFPLYTVGNCITLPAGTYIGQGVVACWSSNAGVNLVLAITNQYFPVEPYELSCTLQSQSLTTQLSTNWTSTSLGSQVWSIFSGSYANYNGVSQIASKYDGTAKAMIHHYNLLFKCTNTIGIKSAFWPDAAGNETNQGFYPFSKIVFTKIQ